MPATHSQYDPFEQGRKRLFTDECAAFECFNEDLVWILEKLVQRTGGVAGVVSGHLAGEEQPTLLAVAGTASQVPALLEKLIFRGQDAPPAAGSQHDVPVINHSLLNLSGAAPGRTERYRVLQLSFSPTERVKVVATVAKQSSLGFKMLEDTVASRLYPVLSRYVRLWWLHRAERRRAHTLSAVTDLSGLAIMLLDQRGALLHSNAHANSLLQAGDGMRLEAGIVHATDAADGPRFAAALEDARQVNQSLRIGQNAGDLSRIFQLQRASGRRSLIVTVAAAASAAVDAADPAVIVYALDPDQKTEQLLRPVCDMYRLTPAEQRIVQHLVSGCRIAEAASLMHIQTDTARVYLKQIFRKTRTNRQADLMRLMLTSALPGTAAISPPNRE